MVDKSKRKFLKSTVGASAGHVLPRNFALPKLVKAVLDVVPSATLYPAQLSKEIREFLMIGSAMGGDVSKDYLGASYKQFGEVLAQLRNEQADASKFNSDLINGEQYDSLIKFIHQNEVTHITIGQLMDTQNAAILRQFEYAPFVEDWEAACLEIPDELKNKNTLADFTKKELDIALKAKGEEILYPEKNIPLSDFAVLRAVYNRVARDRENIKEAFCEQKFVHDKWELFINAFTENDQDEIEALKELSLTEFLEKHLKPIVRRRVQDEIDYILSHEDISISAYEFKQKFYFSGDFDVMDFLSSVVPHEMRDIQKVTVFLHSPEWFESAGFELDRKSFVSNLQSRFGITIVPQEPELSDRLEIKEIGSVLKQSDLQNNFYEDRTFGYNVSMVEHWLGTALPYYDVVENYEEVPINKFLPQLPQP